ncbi:DinB family protein [Actinophytocola sp.]|uniref:DinB family protein n=1 Tax=Actinophytocola sp. TaxID=1872138 RepID=UPI002D6C6151|nr:DinB family protein [Actinophytocola sp.]HYQ63317.1 DinB family protein [Actinophytocola sp.]
MDSLDATRVKQDLLDAADFAFRRLMDRLDGLTDDEYLWEPAPGCWSVRPVGDGTFRADGSPVPVVPAPLTTIAWRMCHLVDLLAGERNATWIGVEPLGRLDRVGEPGTADDAIQQLDQAFTLFRTHVAGAEAAQLTVAMGAIAGAYAASTRAAFVLHELDELIHHGAEVATMRDLYRATQPVEPFLQACLDADRAAVESMLPDDRYPTLVADMAGRQNWAAVRLLVDLGFDVNAAGGVTALHYAAGAGELDIVRLLVLHGADRGVRDSQFDLPPGGWAQYFGQREVAAYLR